MKAIANNPRKSALKRSRVHLVHPVTKVAHCGLRPANGWTEVWIPMASCPRCCAKMARILRRLPDAFPVSS